jgi:type IV pilus assembly protein PilO
MALSLPSLSAEQKKKLAVGVISAFAFCYIYWSYGVKPMEAKIQKEEAQIKQLESQVSNAQLQAQRLPQIQREYADLKTRMADVEKELPKDKYFPGILRLLTHQLQRFHLTLTNLAPGSVQNENIYQSIPQQLTLTGRFHNLGRFLTAIGTQQQILSTENMKVNLAGGDDNNPTIQANFTITAYMAKG